MPFALAGRALNPKPERQLFNAEPLRAARAGQLAGDLGAEAVAEVVFTQRQGADEEGDAVVAERLPERQLLSRGA
jgi:hypothetical protein